MLSDDDFLFSDSYTFTSIYLLVLLDKIRSCTVTLYRFDFEINYLEIEIQFFMH